MAQGQVIQDEQLRINSMAWLFPEGFVAKAKKIALWNPAFSCFCEEILKGPFPYTQKHAKGEFIDLRFMLS